MHVLCSVSANIYILSNARNCFKAAPYALYHSTDTVKYVKNKISWTVYDTSQKEAVGASNDYETGLRSSNQSDVIRLTQKKCLRVAIKNNTYQRLWHRYRQKVHVL